MVKGLSVKHPDVSSKKFSGQPLPLGGDRISSLFTGLTITVIVKSALVISTGISKCKIPSSLT